ncbi:hypothetical protein [Synechococcus phage BUCT-ZZ01]|nr:hypothetical protein [Synechococcus phage BUCT-ZZ01]
MNIKKLIATAALVLVATPSFANFVFVPAAMDPEVGKIIRDYAVLTHYEPIQKYLGKTAGLSMTVHVNQQNGACSLMIVSQVGGNGPNGSIILNEQYVPTSLSSASFKADNAEQCAAGFFDVLENNAKNLLNLVKKTT